MKKVSIISTILIVITFVNLFLSCKKDESISKSKNINFLKSTDNGENQSEEMLVLGEEINDPYAYSNMQLAYNNLIASGEIAPEEIYPNKIYVRFLPENEDQWQELKQDESLILYDYPLNYEIIEYGTYYHDPTLPDSAITWQYSVVPSDYQFPENIYYETIYDVYIPPMDQIEEETEENIYDEYSTFYGKLLYESYRLTGSIDEELEQKMQQQKAKKKDKKWHPSGTIQVYDHLLNRLIPLQEAEVHARYGTHIETDLTNSNGYFYMTDGFLYKVNYAIKWERGRYDIRNGTISQAWYNGPKQKDSWSLNIWAGGKSIMYATIHRAAYKQFYGSNLGIQRPTLAVGKTKICYIDDEGDAYGVYWGSWSVLGIAPDIKIWGKEDGAYRQTYEIFATTTHELGHQAHSRFIGIAQYWQTSKLVYESWARVVEWTLTNDEYHTLGSIYSNNAALYYNQENGRQRWTKIGNSNWEYSPIFIDLIDNFNQSIFYGSSHPNDNITGYSLQYIQNNILDDSYGLSSLYNSVKNHKISGVSDTDVDNLFSLYW